MKTRKREGRFILRGTLRRSMIGWGIFGLAVPAAAQIGLFIAWSRGVPWHLGWTAALIALLALQAAVFAFNLRRFTRKIYRPWAAIEEVIHGVASGGQEIRQLDIGEEDELYGLCTDLNQILSTLEEMAARESRAVLMKKQAELDALQSQINPHFLYNTLESIRGQAMVYGIREIEVMTKALSSLFRYSISSDGSLVPFSSELKNVDNYLMIQQCRFNNKFEKRTNIDPDTLTCQIPKLLIQPIVENAIHHGLEPKIGRGVLTISAYRTMSRLVIQVIDDGVGMEEDKLAAISAALKSGQKTPEGSGTRIGIANVNDRIRLTFGEEYGLRIYSTPKVGTNVEIVLPVKEKEEEETH